MVAKDKERAQEANKRVADLNDSFSKQTEAKMTERLENMSERKSQQIQALQMKLKEHVSHPTVYSKLSFTSGHVWVEGCVIILPEIHNILGFLFYVSNTYRNTGVALLLYVRKSLYKQKIYTYWKLCSSWPFCVNR